MRPNVFRIVGVITKYRTIAPLKQLRPTSFVNRAPISCEEVINLKGRIRKTLVSQLVEKSFLDNFFNSKLLLLSHKSARSILSII